ncbi:hypothetical protein [Aestuariispira insulae]|uniref:Tetratricopeptide repeat protein n=1 Tax=Aestuariispira insulae TaxID=1461337 RepID=A0A3D9H4X2_9PROT|nr:hypothetical protein [Aestuariispira insulae]RED44221.1 hypothetical protein DFP90_11662 [Aestuariispira insulae]
MKRLLPALFLLLPACADLTVALSGNAGNEDPEQTAEAGEEDSSFSVASGPNPEHKVYPRPKARPIDEPAPKLAKIISVDIPALVKKGDQLKDQGAYEEALDAYSNADGAMIIEQGEASPKRLPVLDRIIHTAFMLGQKNLAKNSAQAKERIINANADAWEKGKKNGGILHKQSGLIFPKKFGDLERFSLNAYRIDGKEVSQGYRTSNRRLTIYVAEPTETDSFEAYFGQSIQTIEAQFPSLTKVREDWISNGTYGDTGRGRVAVFKYLNAVEGRNYWTSLALFQAKGQFVKLRFTYPENEALAASRDVQTGLRAIGWP